MRRYLKRRRDDVRSGAVGPFIQRFFCNLMKIVEQDLANVSLAIRALILGISYRSIASRLHEMEFVAACTYLYLYDDDGKAIMLVMSTS